MNCRFCQKEIEGYMEGSLPEGTKMQVEEHLRECPSCYEEFRLLKVAENVFSEEKELESDPFLATRVMALIEEMKPEPDIYARIFGKALKPALITFTLAVALLLGIVAGSLNSPVDQMIQIPDEMSYMDDAFIESIDLFLNE